ncbi:calcium-binding protein [Mangrovicoccus sp. HB161399]|uniref:calcium-binding protein n=1 Tax=Mangrovicoccus sp. HB161399 TaxID=2720392 RepID=UPI001551AB40|nr:calcium-binding protein [Mangrovicoccus sp. HB161399]
MADTISTSGGSIQGDLYGDLWVLARDLDPADGGGNGEPVLDENGQIIPIGFDPVTGDYFPITLVEGTEGDYEVPADQLQYIQEIDLERANIMRSPDQVVESALEEALAKIEGGTVIEADPSGRIMVDGVLIDSPRECLALYKLVMQAGGATSWTEAQANAEGNVPAALAGLMASGWNPTGLLAGVFSKFSPISMDAVITAHTLMDVNEVTENGSSAEVSYYSFTDGGTESFDYDRVATYGDTWIQWYQDLDGDPSDLEAVQRTLLDVIWGTDRNGDGINDVGSGTDWTDQYMALSEDGLSFVLADGSPAGINDWAQAVEDARQAIYVMHESVGTTVVGAPADSDDVIEGSSVADYIAAWGGDDLVMGYEGADWIDGGDGNDTLLGNLGRDTIEGGAGDDELRGGMGDDLLLQGMGKDRLFGGLGNDRLFGGLGADSLDGGDGDDRLNGGFGSDMLTGGDGADSFFFRITDAAHVDTITDFDAAEGDLVRLDQMDADAATAADDAFAFMGYAGFTGTAGELRAADLGGIQRIEGDIDGDGAADFAIDIVGTDAAEAGWFVL